MEIKLAFNYKDFSRKVVHFIMHKSSLILLGVSFLFLAYCALIWYQNVYNYAWDEVKKQEYMNNKNAGTNLNRVKFEKALKDTEKRREEYQKNVENIKDIFRLGQG
ncbi:MAG: hypothetical protein WC823_01685 [Parcubacteria group bacterium]|jgi:uncharacterized membrane protein